jgi:putative transposase
MDEYNKGSHTVYDIKYHVIGVTKYRYKVWQKPIASRLRELIRQGSKQGRLRLLDKVLEKIMFIC